MVIPYNQYLHNGAAAIHNDARERLVGSGCSQVFYVLEESHQCPKYVKVNANTVPIAFQF